MFDGDDDSLCKRSTIPKLMIMRMFTEAFILKGGHAIPSSSIVEAGFVGGPQRDAGKILIVH